MAMELATAVVGSVACTAARSFLSTAAAPQHVEVLGRLGKSQHCRLPADALQAAVVAAFELNGLLQWTALLFWVYDTCKHHVSDTLRHYTVTAL